MLSGNNSSGISYDLALTSGLKVDPTTVDIRKGRQKASEATVNNWAVTGRVQYTGISGLTLSGLIQVQDDITQDSTDNVAGATLVETHVVWNSGPVNVKALYARWDIDGTGASAINKDVQDGGYLEASYKTSATTGIFIRQNNWDNGGAGDTAISQTDLGFSYWPHQDVVIKVDYQAQSAAAGKDSDGFNVGIGYQF